MLFRSEVAAWPQWSAVHAIEAASTQTVAAEHALTAAALAVTPRPRVAASDAHGPDLAGRYCTRLAVDVHDAASLAAEIRAGHTDAVLLDPA